MKRKDSGCGMAVMNAIKSDAVVGLTKEVAEIAADSLIDSEVLKGIPLVSTAVGVVGFFSSVKDNILASKLIRFINELSKVDQTKRIEMIERLNADDKYRGRVGSVLIETLDRMESEKKPELAAKCFTAFAKGEIDFEGLRRVLVVLERLPYFDIERVEDFLKADFEGLGRIDESLALSFVNAGIGKNNGGFDGGIVVPTDLCKTFVKVVMD